MANPARYLLWLTLLWIVLTPFVARADRVYIWNDAEGKKQFSSTPPHWLRNPSPSDPKVEAFEDGKPVPLIPPSQTNPRSPNSSGPTTMQGQAAPSAAVSSTRQYQPALAEAAWPLKTICTYGNDLSSMGHEELASRYCTVAQVARLHEYRAADAYATIQWAQRNVDDERTRALAISRFASASEEYKSRNGASATCVSERQRIVQQHTYLTKGTLKICCDYANKGYSCR